MSDKANIRSLRQQFPNLTYSQALELLLQAYPAARERRSTDPVSTFSKLLLQEAARIKYATTPEP